MAVGETVTGISIHAPREGSDRSTMPEARHITRFQSTLPVRGATNPGAVSIQDAEFQSTLPVRGATAVGLFG